MERRGHTHRDVEQCLVEDVHVIPLDEEHGGGPDTNTSTSDSVSSCGLNGDGVQA